jgi:hypothetical protein
MQPEEGYRFSVGRHGYPETRCSLDHPVRLSPSLPVLGWPRTGKSRYENAPTGVAGAEMLFGLSIDAGPICNPVQHYRAPEPQGTCLALALGVRKRARGTFHEECPSRSSVMQKTQRIASRRVVLYRR